MFELRFSVIRSFVKILSEGTFSHVVAQMLIGHNMSLFLSGQGVDENILILF